MLTTLRIKNLALVADLTLELQPGYNVITGETGAGKSILIGALNLVLGERADRTLIRSGATLARSKPSSTPAPQSPPGPFSKKTASSPARTTSSSSSAPSPAPGPIASSSTAPPPP